MQDLNKHEVLREGLFKRTRYPNFVYHITSFLAETLFKTSLLHLSTQEHMALLKRFHGNKLCELTKDYVFTFPYMDHPSNHLPSDQTRFSTKFRVNAAQLCTIFSTRTDALIHGDLHTGSLMLNQNETYIIDSEFAFMGPMGFDIGLLLANLITAWVSQRVKNTDTDYQEWLLETIKNFHIQFDKKFRDLWTYHPKKTILNPEDFKHYKNMYLQNLFGEAVGFAGLEICRRVCGIAGVKEIRNLDSEEKFAAEQLALKIGQTFVEEYPVLNSVQSRST